MSSRCSSSRPARGQGGFTLIEMVVSLVLFSILGTFAAYGLSVAVRGYLAARSNTAVIMKTQVAMMRLTKEIAETDTAVQPTTTSTSITYRLSGTSHTVAYVSATSLLTYDGSTLTDNVVSFTPSYDNANHLVTLSLGVRSNNVTKTFSMVINTP